MRPARTRRIHSHPLTASRENDLLVLRWHEAPYGEDDYRVQRGIGRITLPARFAQLSVEYAFIDAQAPAGRLQVSGVWAEVSGRIAHLDLRSAGCQWPCAAQTIADSGAKTQVCEWNSYDLRSMLRLKADARFIPSLQATAVAGRVELTGSTAIERLDLQLADWVQLTVDAALLDPRRVAITQDYRPSPWAVCAPLLVTAPAPGAVALEFWPGTPGSEKPAQQPRLLSNR